MSAIDNSIPVPGGKKPRRVLVYRHALVTRLTHWVNALCIFVLLMSGLQIFIAHPALYWGHYGADADHPALEISADESDQDHPVGITKIGKWQFVTTGVLGVSRNADGDWSTHAFPGWATLPSWRDLATGRRWHFFFAWCFVINGLIYLIAGLVNGHFRRDLLPSLAQLRPSHVLHDIADHIRLRFPKGEAARHYNILQKFAYLGVFVVLLPAMVLTGLTMSPGFDAIAPFLVDLFGGRQSARTIHFIAASLILAFIIVHLLMVLLAGVWNEVRSMITGRYAITIEDDHGQH